MNLQDLFAQEKTRIWDNIVPIITIDNITRAYITTGIEEPEHYNELCFRLQTATKGEKFELHLNTPGGMIDSAFMICDALKNTQAHVTAYLSGTVASAGTIITMACHDIVVSDHLSFMIHNYSAGVHGKGHEMKARQEFLDNSLNEAFRSFYTGFLSPKEMDEIIDGKDLWIGSSEVRSRWANKQTQQATPPKRGRPKKA